MVQLSVLDRTRTTPPASPADGDRHLVASGVTGLWDGWDLNITFWIDGAWIRQAPRTGWLTSFAAEALFLVWTGSAWEVVGEPSDISDAVFSLINDADPTKKAVFSLSGISTTRSYTLPNTSSELATLAGTQTFTGTLTASGAVTVSGTATTIGTATGTATYGVDTGTTTTGLTKTVNLGAGGAPGSRRPSTPTACRARPRRLHLCEPAVACHTASDRHGVLRPLWLDGSASHDPLGSRQLHRLPARRPHKLTTGP